MRDAVRAGSILKEEVIMMRMVLIVGLVGGTALAGTSGASAVAVSGTVIGDLAFEHVTPVRWGHERFYHRRWGGYGYHHWRGRGWRRW